MTTTEATMTREERTISRPPRPERGNHSLRLRLIAAGAGAVAIAAGIFGYNEYRSNQTSQLNGVTHALAARGINMSHITLERDGKGYEATYSDKALDPKCIINFDVKNQNPNQPYLQSVISSEFVSKSASGTSGLELGSVDQSWPISDAASQAKFFSHIATLSTNGVCKDVGN
jgi:subtilisin family serine protease